MKRYTQEEFDAMPVEDGIKQCPSGDYSAIGSFGSACRFDVGCYFGAHCYFGAECYFGSACRFGVGCYFDTRCYFGAECYFGAWCRFNAECRFGVRCYFNTRCYFGAECYFGAWCCFNTGCHFGEWCRFSERSSFNEGCYFEDTYKAKTTNPYIAIDRAGSAHRKTYFFDFEEGIHVRSGCFFGTLAEFRQKVLKDCEPESIKAKQYLSFANIAAVTFGGEVQP